MSLFFCPVRPLSCSGRVLLCVVVSIFAALLLVAWSPARADDSEARKAESPYFAVNSSEPGTDRLPLKATRVDVRIAGVIADVTITQTYRNEGQRAIEARYVFPGSTQSAVYAMNVRLGGRLLTARIKEKQHARIEYETAKKEGKTSALLEQHRPNVFEMNVANILPGDDVAVELHYTELLTPTDALYGFVFPTVVGPRYNSPQGAAVAEKWIATPYLRSGETSTATFDLKLTLDTPVAVREISSSSHEIDVQGDGSMHASVALKSGSGAANDRDFILHYRLAGDHIETGLMLFRGESENFFLALVEPPKAVPVRQINPREYVFVVDISGSMHGYPLETSKVLLADLIGGLRPSDTFNVMLFSGSNRLLAPTSVPATRANIERALQTIRAMGGSGSTEIVPALKRIAELPKAPDVSRSVIVMTDGYVSVEAEVFQLIRKNLNHHNVFAFGIGTSVNRHLIEGIARAGQGEAFIVTKPSEAAAQAERLRKMIEAPVLAQVKAHFEGLDVYDVEPAQLPDVLGGRPVLVFGKWRGDAAASARASMVVEGRGAEGPFRAEVSAAGREDQISAALRHLWARQRIAALSDQEALEGGSAQKAAITDLGTPRPACARATRRSDAAAPFGVWLPRAVVAAEDQRFYEHTGYDLIEMRSALRSDDAQHARGASSLSQQLAKLLYTGDERSAVRKLREALYAVEMDRTLGKARVLQIYLAVAPWGQGQCGAQAAALQLLNKRAAALTPIEAAWLSSLLRNPDAELARMATSGAVDTARVGDIIEAMRPLARARREDLREQLADWAPPLTNAFAAR